MNSRIPGFRGEYLWELDIPQTQLLALAEAVPAEMYRWRPVGGARAFSSVLVHIAAGNLALLRLVGARVAEQEDLYGLLPGDRPAQFAAMIRRNVALEQTLTQKQDVIDLLRRSLEAVRRSFTACSAGELDSTGDFFGELTTVRRVYLRMLAHTHEHMGQAIAYARASGINLPWPDPLKEFDRMTADARSSGISES